MTAAEVKVIAVGMAPVDMIPAMNAVGNPDVVEPVPIYPKFGMLICAPETDAVAAVITDPPMVPTEAMGNAVLLAIAPRIVSCAEAEAATIDAFNAFVFEVAADDAPLNVNALMLFDPVNPWLNIIGQYTLPTEVSPVIPEPAATAKLLAAA